MFMESRADRQKDKKMYGQTEDKTDKKWAGNRKAGMNLFRRRQAGRAVCGREKPREAAAPAFRRGFRRKRLNQHESRRRIR